MPTGDTDTVPLAPSHFSLSFGQQILSCQRLLLLKIAGTCGSVDRAVVSMLLMTDSHVPVRLAKLAHWDELPSISEGLRGRNVRLGKTAGTSAKSLTLLAEGMHLSSLTVV